MSTPTIQRQSIISTLVIFLGFGFGALNLIVLQPRILSTAEFGLTRVVAEASILLANFATLGTTPVIAKFFPFYRRYLPEGKMDLPAITGIIFAAGLMITLILLQLAKPWIIQLFGKNNPLFAPYYFTLSIFLFFQAIFLYMELYAWFAGRVILANTLKELIFRILTTIGLAFLGFRIINFTGFMVFFSFLYLPLSALLIFFIIKRKGFTLNFSVSNLTRRLSRKMISLGSFVFLTALSSIAFVVCDTLFLAGIYNFEKAAIYSVAQYFSQVLEIPMRSIQTSSVPLISEYWRAKNYSGLLSVYRKSCLNLLIAGIGLGGLILINLHNIERFFPSEYAIMSIPIAILIVSRWINLGTGLNATLIQLSNYWRFDFASTLSYSFLGIPLNYFMITSYGMIGAAIANVIAVVVYNSIRFTFLWKKFNLQPFGWQNLWVLLAGIVIIGSVYVIPQHDNIYIDGILRSILFSGVYGFFIIRFRLSEEVTWLWQKWSKKLLPF